MDITVSEFRSHQLDLLPSLPRRQVGGRRALGGEGRSKGDILLKMAERYEKCQAQNEKVREIAKKSHFF